MVKIKIVLDADVIIHFHKGERLATLPDILNEYEHIVLSYVRDEILHGIRTALDNQISFLGNIKLVEFNPQGEMAREYALLKKTRGKGESACMSYCKFTNNVIGSSNLKDIKEYCVSNNITYLTTCDFLYYGWVRGKMTENEIKEFVRSVRARGSIIPDFDVHTYRPNAML